MLPILIGQRMPAGFAGPEFDLNTALRLAEAEGVPMQVAAPLVASIQSGVRAAQRRMAEQKEA